MKRKSKMWQRSTTIAITALIALGATPAALAAPAFYIKDITDPSTTGSCTAYGINKYAQVVGTHSGKGFVWQWPKGPVIWLPALGGTYSSAKGINDTGQIIGNAQYVSGQSGGAMWQGTTVKALGSGPGGSGWAINNSGAWIGYIKQTVTLPGATCNPKTLDISRAVVSNVLIGKLTYPTPCEYAIDYGVAGATGLNVFGISESGTVAMALFTSGGGKAALYSGGKFNVLGLTPAAAATAVNSKGQVTGEYSYSGTGSAFFYDGGVTTPLNFGVGYYARGYDINEQGQVVGAAVRSTGGGGFLYLPAAAYTLSKGMYDLNKVITGWTVWKVGPARAINEAGMMVGSGTFQYKSGRCYVAWPIGYTPPPPPAPFKPGANFRYSGTVSDPINTHTGGFYYPYVEDLDLGGPRPLVFWRYYANGLTRAGISGALGAGWRHVYEWELKVSGTSATVVTGTGREATFELKSAAWVTTGVSDVTFQLASKGTGYELIDPSTHLIYTFDAGGALISISDDLGRVHTLTRNTSGDLTSVSDGLGRKLILTYDSAGMLASVSDGGRTVTFTHSGGALTKVKDPMGGETTYAYDSAGYLTSTTRPLGNAPQTQVYDATGRVSSQTDAAGVQTKLSYGASDTTTITDPFGKTYLHVHKGGVLTSLTDQAGNQKTFSVGTHGRWTSVTNAMGEKTSFSYHADSGEVATVTYADGTSLSHTHTARAVGGVTVHDVTKTTYPDGSSDSFAYDTAGNLTTVTDRAGQATKATYNTDGQPLTLSLPSGATSTLTYNTDGTLASTTDHSGNATTYTYDSQRRLTAVTLPDGKQATYSHDTAGRVLNETDELGGVTKYTYDDNGNLASLTNQLAQTTTYGHDKLDRLETITLPRGGSFSVSYDKAGRVAGITDPVGIGDSLIFDAVGNLTSATDAAGKVWSWTHDKAGRQLTAKTSLGHVRTRTYDKLGRETSFTDPLGGVTSYTYDTMGRVTAIKGALGQTTTFAYDKLSALIATTLPTGVAASYTRDGLGLVTKITDPLGNGWAYGWDARGRLTSVVDPLGNKEALQYDKRSWLAKKTLADGKTLTINHDPTGLPTRLAYEGGPDLKFTYDAAGRLTVADNLALSYDADGEMSACNGLAIKRDLAGQVTSLTLASGKAVTYSYDTRGLLAKVQDWVGGATTLSRDDAGRLSSVARPNGVVTSYSYDKNNFVVGITEKDSAGIVLASVTLTRNALGLITGAKRSAPSTVGKLVSRTDTFSYDAASQRKGVPHDVQGRVTKDAIRTYSWDHHTRLTSYTEGSAKVGFTHDGVGRVFSRSAGSTGQTFVWNYGTDLPSLAVVRQGGQDLRYYIHTPSGLLLHSVDASDNRRFYHFDEMGSTLLLTDDKATVTDSYAYTPYGIVSASKGTSDNPFTFGGSFGVMREGKSDLYWMGLRLYDARAARFLSREPLAGDLHPMAINPYVYAACNPLRFVDPTGEAPGVKGQPQQNPRDKASWEQSTGDTLRARRDLTYLVEKGAKARSKRYEKVLGKAKKGVSKLRGEKLSKRLRLLQKLGDGADKWRDTSKVAAKTSSLDNFSKRNRIGGVGAVVDVAKARKAINKAKRQTLNLQDAALQGLISQLKAVQDARKAKRIPAWYAEQLMRAYAARFAEALKIAERNGQIDTAIAFLNVVKSTFGGLLPVPVQYVLQKAGLL